MAVGDPADCLAGCPNLEPLRESARTRRTSVRSHDCLCASRVVIFNFFIQVFLFLREIVIGDESDELKLREHGSAFRRGREGRTGQHNALTFTV